MAVNPFHALPFVLEKRKREIANLVTHIARRAAAHGGAALAADTAVDTGEARSNWIMSLGAPSDVVIPPYFPYPKLGDAAATASRKGETLNLRGAMAQHAKTTAEFDVRRYSTIFIRNNVGHIGDIEGGHSPQTAPGLLGRGLEAARESVIGTWRLRPV